MRWEPADNTFSETGDPGQTTDSYKPTNKVQFTPWTKPNSDRSNGNFTGIAVTNINQPGNNITADIILNFSSGTLTENSWWEGTESITGNVTLNSGKTLTVTPNTTVTFSSSTTLTVNGSLVANSTSSSQRITFTRLGTSGSWGGIKINSGSSANASILRRCDVNYATSGIIITYADNNNDVTVEKCRISDNSNDGIYVYGRSTASKDPTISSNHIHDNGSSGIRLQNYARPTVTGNRIEYHPEYGIHASGSASATVQFNYVQENGRAGMAFHSNSHAELHRNTVTQNLDDAGIYITSSSNLIAYGGTDTNKGRNKIVANNYNGIYSNSSSPVFGRDVTTPTNQYGYNQIQDNGNVQASQSGSGQLQAERCYWAGQHNDISGNVDNSPYLTAAPSPVGWGQTDGYDPSTRVLINPGLIADDGQQNAPVSNEVVYQSDATSNDFDAVRWSLQFNAAMKAGLEKGDWADAAEVITQLWRELQHTRVPTLDYAMLADYVERSEVASSIRKYLALTLVEKSLAVQDVSTALNDLAKYRQRNPEHIAELLANVGIINLHFKNNLVAAEEILSQLRALAAQNDEAAAEQEKLLSMMIGNYRQHFGTAAASKPASYALAPVTEVETSLLLGNYPNPFNPETMIRYRVLGERPQEVSLVIFNTVGQQVRTLVLAKQNPGDYSVPWDGHDNFGKEVASGMYFLRAAIGARALTRKLMLLR